MSKERDDRTAGLAHEHSTLHDEFDLLWRQRQAERVSMTRTVEKTRIWIAESKRLLAEKVYRG